MKTIDLNEWGVSYTELVEWAEGTGSEIFALVHHGGNGASATYGFEKDEDLLAFKLKFAKELRPHKMGYTGIVTMDVGIHNCPYIPIIK